MKHIILSVLSALLAISLLSGCGVMGAVNKQINNLEKQQTVFEKAEKKAEKKEQKAAAKNEVERLYTEYGIDYMGALGWLNKNTLGRLGGKYDKAVARMKADDTRKAEAAAAAAKAEKERQDAERYQTALGGTIATMEQGDREKFYFYAICIGAGLLAFALLMFAIRGRGKKSDSPVVVMSAPSAAPMQAPDVSAVRGSSGSSFDNIISTDAGSAD